MNLRTRSILAGLVVLCVCAPLSAAPPAALGGDILGQVRNNAGIAQMGATVFLYNRYDELVRQSLTGERGRFAFDSLVPGLYSIRVVLASFVPAERRNIAVLPDSENRLDINLAGVLSTVELAPPTASQGTLMSDEWKWVLRSSQSTRPVLRVIPDAPNPQEGSGHMADVFSNTSGVVKISAGEGQSFTRGMQQDLGTAFALATSLAGAGRVQMSGNLGYGQNAGAPAGGFRTSYSRQVADGSSPEVVLTMRQTYLSPRVGSGIAVGADGAPTLRTMSLAFVDRVEVAENVKVDYGFDMQSVTYLDRLNYASPFLRATYDAGSQGRVRVAYSSGAHPTELMARDEAERGGLDQELTALALMPRVSLSNSRAVVERTQNFEVGYERVAGSRTYSVGAYQEFVSNAAFMLNGEPSWISASDLLPDLNSQSSIFNVGSYQRMGYTAALKQAVTQHFEVGAAVGRTGALLAGGLGSWGGDAAATNDTTDASAVRSGFRQGQRMWVTVRASGRIPRSGTQVTANYGWTDFRVLMPAHVYLTQKQAQDIGWNLYVRQPLPCFNGLPWRMELTAELRNLLAQGYVPLGPRTILTNSPRAVRGGLNFIF